MPRQRKYDAQIGPIPVTSAMLEHLGHLSGLKGKPLNDLVRTAIREYLDNQGEVAGSRRWFTQQFRETVEDGFRLISWQLTLLTILVAHAFSLALPTLLMAQLKPQLDQAAAATDDPARRQAAVNALLRPYQIGGLLEEAQRLTTDKGWVVFDQMMTTIQAAAVVHAAEHDDQREED